MGCDIHAVFQAKRDGRWQDVESMYEEGRDYELFAWLAGVRDRFGIGPISDPRGLPADFDIRDETHNDKWLGDHSHSWLTAAEILSAPLPNTVPRSGVVERKFLQTWNGVSRPPSYCQGIAGPNVVVAQSVGEITPETTHVRVEWPMPLDEMSYFLDEIKRLRDKHGEVRMVFGFDS